MRLEVALGALALTLCTAAHAQFASDAPWQEADAPPPPPVQVNQLISLDVPDSSLKFGVAPESVTVGRDGVVRYVVVTRNSAGAISAIYEGLRCGTGEYKVYARQNAGSGWNTAQDAAWRSLDQRPVQRHTIVIARNGACVGRSANFSVADILRDLRKPGELLNR